MENLKLIFYLTVLPGLLFTAVAGGLLSWFDRKLSARVQWRRGPAWFQPFADLAKLMGKETIVPAAGSLGRLGRVRPEGLAAARRASLPVGTHNLLQL